MEMNRKETFTCIGRGHGAPCLPSGREEWEQMRRQPWLGDMCRRIEQGEEKLKHRLPVWTPHCAEFKDNHRAIADAVRPLHRLMLDFDEKGHTEEILSQLKLKSEKLRVAGLEVLLVEESVRRGTHVLVSLPGGMTADEAQRLMAEATGFSPDKAVKDVARCIYMVPEDHTRYVSEGLWNPTEHTEHTESTEHTEQAEHTEKQTTPQPPGEGQGEGLLLFRGIPYADIIREYWLRTGGEPQEGERNVRLHKLAVNLRAICDNRADVLMQVMPRLGLSDTELQSIVDSATKEQPKGISKMMASIINNLQFAIDNEGLSAEDTESVDKDTLLSGLPVGLRESLVGVPREMQMPVLCGVLPLAAAYADAVEVEYSDGQRHRLGLMSIIRGEQASGKSVVKSAVDVWKRQFEEEDRQARQREDEWRERRKGRKANEKAPEDPRVLVRMVPVTVSCSTLLKRIKNAAGHCLYSFGEELDTLRKTNGAGSWSSKYDIYRLSFDQGEWGQDYNSDTAESGVVKVAYNWTMLGTDGAMRKCFRQDNIENGLSSRILVSEMPDSSFQKMPKYGHRSAEDEARIQEAVTRLRSSSGFIDTPRLREAIERWVEEKRVEAAKDIDRVKDIYRKRAAVIGFRCGVVHHLLTGETAETAATLRFATLMADYCLEGQIKAFGEALENEFVSAKEQCKRYSANHSAFDQLPPVFTMDDLRALKRCSCTDNSIRMVISRWRREGWIEKTSPHQWQKRNIATLQHCNNKEF